MIQFDDRGQALVALAQVRATYMPGMRLYCLPDQA